MANLVRRAALAQFLPTHEAIREWESMQAAIARLLATSLPIPSGGSSGQVLTKGIGGGYVWSAPSSPSGSGSGPWNFDMGNASGPAAGAFDLGSAA